MTYKPPCVQLINNPFFAIHQVFCTVKRHALLMHLSPCTGLQERQEQAKRRAFSGEAREAKTQPPGPSLSSKIQQEPAPCSCLVKSARTMKKTERAKPIHQRESNTRSTKLSTTTAREQNRALGPQVYGRYPNPGKHRKAYLP